MLRSHHLLALLALASSLALAAPAAAGTLLSEDFSGAAPGAGITGAISGTAFKVTNANIDIVGVLNGNFFTCDHNPGGNCLDLVGEQSAGAIASNTAFSLTAGATYTITFGAVLQGFAVGQGLTKFTVGLGDLAQSESLTGGTAQLFSLSFVQGANATSALSFTTTLAGDDVHGAVLDHIVLSEKLPSTTAVPEPASWALMLLGFGGAGAMLRRRRRSAPAVL